MNRELWVSGLSFVATLVVLALQLLPVSPELVPWLTWAVAAINAALGIFFGVSGFKARAAAKAKAAK